MPFPKVDWNPSDKKVRQFGAGLLLCAAIAGWAMERRGRPAGPYVLEGGLALGLASALLPAFGRLVYRAWMGAASVIGGAVSAGALAFAYYGVLTPLALFFRLRGRDALGLGKSGRQTYWTPVRAPKDDAYYERLF